MKITEQDSKYSDLDKMSTSELLKNINSEDKTVAFAVEKCIPQIEKLVDALAERVSQGGRLFYIGAGTSGRLGIVDASEIPPTYGVYDTIVGIIAGGDGAIRNAAEGAEDNRELGAKALKDYNFSEKDTVLGIASSGTTPYVLGALEEAKRVGGLAASLTCNPDAPVSAASDIAIVAVTGPEFVTGSTRMKAGTSQKMILNMISTSLMIKLGRVRGNRMVDMSLSNKKLVERGAKMVMAESGITNFDEARELLLKYGSVRAAVDAYIAENKKV